MRKFALISSLVVLIGVVMAFIGVPVFADSLPHIAGLDDAGKAAPLLLGNVSLFKSRTMMAALDERKGATTFLLRTFFRGEEVFGTKAVDIEIIKGKRRLAPFVAPVVAGKLMEKDGRVMKTFEPPYVKPLKALDPSDLNAPSTGETIYAGGKNHGQRLAEKTGKLLAEADDEIMAREEWMAAQELDTGAVIIQGDGVDTSIDFQMNGTHKITLTGTDLWSDTVNSDPGADIRAWCELNAKDSGVVSGIAVAGTDAMAAFINHPKVTAKLDNKNIEQGKIDPTLLPEGVTFVGTYRDIGVNVDLYTYQSWYTDDDGNTQPYVPADKFWLGSSAAKNKKLYGMIQDLKAGNFAVKRFPKSWEKEDPSVRYILVQSAPLPALLQPDAFVSAKVV
ncbi:major capsid protein [uncultured Desulfuromusa sp.]|uniref:major capsid protein n=1 Tax=uncultured Desulfuromusa sp. TaxID=219183 RepID=UPI002AA61F2F|nr:major capsid protein [uncultured Desulfuromusa sp.]